MPELALRRTHAVDRRLEPAPIPLGLVYSGVSRHGLEYFGLDIRNSDRFQGYRHYHQKSSLPSAFSRAAGIVNIACRGNRTKKSGNDHKRRISHIASLHAAAVGKD